MRLRPGRPASSRASIPVNRPDMPLNLGSLAVAVVEFLFRSHYVVRGNSMSPTLRDGDIVHAIPAGLTGRRIRRGAIVVATLPGQSGHIIIKRVAGLPGEWVSVSQQGVPHAEADGNAGTPQVEAGGRDAGAAEPAARWLCDDDEFFLVGDNLSESSDSRRYGPVRASAIIGTVWLKAPTHPLLQPRGRRDDRATPPDLQ